MCAYVRVWICHYFNEFNHTFEFNLTFYHLRNHNILYVHTYTQTGIWACSHTQTYPQKHTDVHHEKNQLCTNEKCIEKKKIHGILSTDLNKRIEIFYFIINNFDCSITWYWSLYLSVMIALDAAFFSSCSGRSNFRQNKILIIFVIY